MAIGVYEYARKGVLTDQPFHMMWVNYNLAKKNLVDLKGQYFQYYVPVRAPDGSLTLGVAPEYRDEVEKLMERQVVLGGVILDYEKRFEKIQELTEEAEKIAGRTLDPTPGGIMEAALYFSNRVAIMENDLKGELEFSLNRGLPTDNLYEKYQAVRNQSSPEVKKLLKLRTQLEAISGQVRKLCEVKP